MTGWRVALGLATLLLAPALAAKTLHPDYLLRTQRLQAFGPWQAGCDNLGNCSGIGPLPCADDTPIILAHWGAALAESPALEVVGQITVPPERMDRLRTCLAQDADFAALAAAISQWQALVPVLPADHLPPLQTLPAIEHMVSGAPPQLPPAHVCQGRALHLRQFGWADGGDSLWQVRCDPASAQSYWFRWPRGSEQLQPLVLPNAGRAVLDAGMAGLASASFEFDLGVLRAVEGGVSHVWGWTQQGWQQLERRELDLSGALALVPEHQWLRTFQSAGAVASNEVDQ